MCTGSPVELFCSTANGRKQNTCPPSLGSGFPSSAVCFNSMAAPTRGRSPNFGSCCNVCISTDTSAPPYISLTNIRRTSVRLSPSFSYRIVSTSSRYVVLIDVAGVRSPSIAAMNSLRWHLTDSRHDWATRTEKMRCGSASPEALVHNTISSRCLRKTKTR